MQNRTILLTAGSTGGHLFPTLAIAQVLKDRGENIIFVTDKRGESILRFHNSQNLGNIISYSSQLLQHDTTYSDFMVGLNFSLECDSKDI